MKNLDFKIFYYLTKEEKELLNNNINAHDLLKALRVYFNVGRKSLQTIICNGGTVMVKLLTQLDTNYYAVCIENVYIPF